MSATRNVEAMNNKQGEFQPAVPRSEPLEKHGHQPGRKAAPADNVPESHVEVLPPGSAPRDKTYVPQTTSEVPSQANNEYTLRSHGKESTQTPASATLGGATSQQVNKGFGHPGEGQTSSEIRHEGEHHRKHQGAGLEGVGSFGKNNQVDERITASQRALDKDVAASGQRGNKGQLGAEDIPPTSSEELASERR